jgi:hypothetical protein
MIRVFSILASVGEHGVRPYNICVGANSMFALARTASGTQTKTEVKA